MFSPHAFSRATRQLHVFASNSDWLVVSFTSVAIGQSNYFGFGFSTLDRPFPSCYEPHWKFEAKCKQKLVFILMQIELIFI